MELRTKDKIFFVLVFMGILLFVVNRLTHRNNVMDEARPIAVTIGNAKVVAEAAFSRQKMIKGLGQRDNLGENEGMIFLHFTSGQFQYVMRDMKFDLDFIFISGETIVDIAKGVPKDFDGVIKGNAVYDKVLEVNSGWVEKNGVKLGDKVEVDL